MISQNVLVSEPAEKVLLLTRIFDAPAELVFKAWSDCKYLKHWWGPKDYTTHSCKIDFHIGGNWRICIRSAEGTEHWHHGVYQEIKEPERLVFTHAWEYPDKPGHETLVTVLFEELDGKTKFTFHQAFFIDEIDRDNHKLGWNGCFDHLKAQFEVKS